MCVPQIHWGFHGSTWPSTFARQSKEMTASVKSLETLLLDRGDVSDVSDVAVSFFLQRLGSYFEGFMIRVGCFVIQDECKARFLDRTAFLRTVRCFLKDYQDYQLQPFHHKNTGTIFLITQLTADITSHPNRTFWWRPATIFAVGDPTKGSR